MAVTTRQELIDYCLRALGAPVIQIDVDVTQLEDRVDEGLQYYQEYHSDAILDSYFKILVTAQDVTNGYITLPAGLTVVKRVLPILSGSDSGSIFNVDYQLALNDVFLLNGGAGGFGNQGIANYVMTQQYMEMLNQTFYGTQQQRFNKHTGQLELIDVTLVEGMYVVIDGSMIVDPTTYSKVYNDMFLKQYCTALIKRQWASNLKKFEGVVLPGGIQFNGQVLFDEATTEINETRLAMQLNYEEPADMFIG
jgi:hypothetical protein